MKNLEELLSRAEIHSILLESANSIYKNPDVLFFPVTGRTMILRIGQKNGVIMVHGDEHTGFTHIIKRHNYHSETDYWKKEEDKNGNRLIKLEDPSRFSKESIPIYHYTGIADKIFTKENLNIKKNKRPDLFDLYTGVYQYEKGKPMKYHLITYKDTPVVHTLYPDKRKFNKKKIVNLFREKVYGKELPHRDTKTIFIPYRDHLKTRYTILIRKEYQTQKEVISIAKHGVNGEPEKVLKVGERDLVDNFSIQHEMLSYQYSDLTNLEKILKKVIDSEEKDARG